MESKATNLAELESELKYNYLTWYEKSYTTWLRLYISLQILSILTSFLAVLFAAFIGKDSFDSWAKPLLVILPLLSGLAGAVLTQGNFMPMIRLRDEGRIDIMQLIFDVQKSNSLDLSEENRRNAVIEIRGKLIALERRQSAAATGLWKEDFVAGFKSG